jgi:hypothetical protein
VSTLALALGLYLGNRYPVDLAGSSLLMLAPALAGLYAGRRLRGLLSPPVFRRCFFGGLLVLGAHLLVHGWIDQAIRQAQPGPETPPRAQPLPPRPPSRLSGPRPPP